MVRYALLGAGAAILLGCGPSLGLPGEDEAGLVEDEASDGELDEPDAFGEPEEPVEPAACLVSDCIERCEWLERYELGDGTTCSCSVLREPEDYTSCDLPDPCGGDRLCMVESIRDGVVGHYRLESGNERDAFVLEVEVLGPGRARASTRGTTQDCCDGSQVNEFGTYYNPQDVLPPDAPDWDECITKLDSPLVDIPPCLLPHVLLVGACEPPLTECPGEAPE